MVEPSDPPDTLLLVLPVPMFRWQDRLWFEAQACNGLRLWQDNFGKVIVCVPTFDRPPPAGFLLLDEALAGRVPEVHPLPLAYTPLRFARVLPAVLRELDRLIARAAHLQFAIGGLWGDWGAVAALLAKRRGRKAAVWTDRVESEVMRFQAQSHSGVRRAYRLFNAGLARHFERFVIRRSAMGLFHGMDTYSTYAGFNRSPHLVHDIHVGEEARISAEELAAKLARSDEPARPLQIVYAGRAHPDKGVADWIEVLALLAARGIAFQATWHGDGPELERARQTVAGLGLEDRIAFPGPTQDHDALMAALRDADIFLFCHKTPESPRCLIEALISGTPIIGYGSAYPQDLIAGHGGGLLTEMQPRVLADAVAELAANPRRAGDLAERAARDGFNLIDTEVFRHRSDLIKSLAAG